MCVYSNVVHTRFACVMSEETPVMSVVEPVEGLVTPDSFAELPVIPMSRELSVQEDRWRWRVGSSSFIAAEAAQGTYVSGYGDTHPDMIATLLAEYLTDTILRIDNEAKIDLSVTLKADLIVVLGEVICSHPAKGGIVHSDQFLMTLNSSLREVLKDVILRDDNKTNSEQLEPSSPSSNDPMHAHVIIALDPLDTQDVVSAISETTVFTETCTVDEMVGLALCQSLVEQFPLRGLKVCVCIEDKFCQEIVFSFSSDDMEAAVAGIKNALATDTHTGVLSKETVVSVMHANREKLTGHSKSWSGKDFRNPKRIGPILAAREAQTMVRETEADTHVTLTLRGTEIISVHTNSHTKETRDTNEPTHSKTLSYSRISESILKNEQEDFFALKHAGSTCSPNYVRM